jgi:rhamnulokinase
MAEGMLLAAIDIGAETGRSVLGRFGDDRLEIEEVHRFPNHPVAVRGRLHWDALRLFADVTDGVRAAGRVRSVGVDTWGVDFALVDRNGGLVGNPVHYRDRRTEGMIETATRLVAREEIYARTGIQFIPINTLYQLLALVISKDPQLEVADRLLTMPALFAYWLTGTKADEYTAATTTQCFDARAGVWARDLLERLGIPTRIFGEVVTPGTDLGRPRPEIGVDADRLIAPGTHDTASAVAAVPLKSARHAAYISSGTWSLAGIETTEPIINQEAMDANLTNEGGVAGTFRVLKNVMGLWLLQECRRAWAARGMEISYDELMRLAELSPAFAAVIDPDDQRLLRPGDMPGRIIELASESGHALPSEPGPVVRCILESLAVKYHDTLAKLERIAGLEIQTIHIVGGGANNRLLCQMTADACGCEVVAGPIEATAIGNLLVQATALGMIGSLEQGRDLVRRSFVLQTYEPRMDAEWSRLRKLA